MATLVRWAPFSEVASLQNEMSRFMNGLLESNGRATQSWIPTADVWETEDGVVYAFDLPGIPEDEISIELDEGALTISAERARAAQVEDGRYARFERRFGTFTRTIGLPQGVTEDDVKADYSNGVLEVRVAKPQQPQPKRIQIGLTGSQPKTIEGNSTEK